MEQILNITIKITDPETNKTVRLEQKDVQEVHRTLGGWKTIAGNHEEQSKSLIRKEQEQTCARNQIKTTHAISSTPSLQCNLYTSYDVQPSLDKLYIKRTS